MNYWFPGLNKASQNIFILNLKKIKSNNDVLQSVIADIIENYERKEKEEKLAKIIMKLFNQQLFATEIVKIFDKEIKPLNVKIPLDTFKKIIQKYDLAFAQNPSSFLKFIGDNLLLITEYANKQEETTQALTQEFIKAIQKAAALVLPGEKAHFIANLKQVTTNNNSIKKALSDIIENYTQEQEDERVRDAALLNLAQALKSI
jgi:hypothetical protein